MPDRNLKKSLFELGQIVATPGSIEALQQAVISAASLLCSHQCGDWGDLENKDLAENKRALNQGFRIFSSYHITKATKIWIITESDRSVTTCCCLKRHKAKKSSVSRDL